MFEYPSGVAVVTGGANGIGRALAVEAARRGASVMIGDVVDASETIAEIEGLGGRASWQICDVASLSDVESLREATTSLYGDINLVCSNVSVGVSGPLHTTSADDFERILRVNVVGSYNVLATFAEVLIRTSARGLIAHFLFTGSENSLGVPPIQAPPYVGQVSAYTLSKQAIFAMAAVARRDLAESGVRVAIVCPGWTWNERLKQIALVNERMSQIFDAYAQEPAEVARRAFDGLANGVHIIPTNPVSCDFVIETHREIIRAMQSIQFDNNLPHTTDSE